MKILAISTWFPYPPDNGSKARTCNLLRHLGTRHDIDLLAMSQSADDLAYVDDVRKFCRRVESFPERQFRPERVNSWLGFLSPVPRYFREHHCPEIRSLAIQRAREEHYDAVLAVTLGAAPYVSDLNGVFTLLDQHNVESQIIKRRWRNERSAVGRLRYAPTWMKAERFERAISRKFGAITVVSEVERLLMQRLLGNHDSQVYVIPNGVDPGFLDYRPPMREKTTFVFSGALTYSPNYEAAVVLCREILPALRAAIPEVRLRITGRIDGVDTENLARTPGVELTGYVGDIRPVVGSASALIVPLKQGGGTRLKILEAMALGTPVISTPMGAEGIEARDGQEVLLGNDADCLANQALRLLNEPELGRRIAKNAKKLVRERYQWPTIAGQFEQVIANGLERRTHA